jgi:hypothetical protein
MANERNETKREVDSQHVIMARDERSENKRWCVFKARQKIYRVQVAVAYMQDHSLKFIISSYDAEYIHTTVS